MTWALPGLASALHVHDVNIGQISSTNVANCNDGGENWAVSPCMSAPGTSSAHDFSRHVSFFLPPVSSFTFPLEEEVDVVQPD